MAAARAHGDSMIDLGVTHGDFVLFERVALGTVVAGETVVIGKEGDEEGFGSWALKKLVVVHPRMTYHDSIGSEIDWDDPVIVLHSRNRKFLAQDLDPTGKYRVHGRFLRALSPDQARLVDSEAVRRLVEGAEIDPD